MSVELLTACPCCLGPNPGKIPPACLRCCDLYGAEREAAIGSSCSEWQRIAWYRAKGEQLRAANQLLGVCKNADGTTRPWTTEELRAQLKAPKDEGHTNETKCQRCGDVAVCSNGRCYSCVGKEWPFVKGRPDISPSAAIEAVAVNPDGSSIGVVSRDAVTFRRMTPEEKARFWGDLVPLVGTDAAMRFLTGYALEKALSVDNLVVFGLVFSFFRLSSKDEYRVLHYGIVGAVVFRLVFVLLGMGSFWAFGRLAELGFGAVVLWSAVKVLRGGEPEAKDPNTTWYVRLAKRAHPTIGPLVLCAVAIECTDVLFAFDSVPTVISVTREPLLIYPAMLFAILGLRAMYFVLAALARYTSKLSTAVAVVLLFVGAKLLAHGLFKFDVSPELSLIFVLATLSTGVILSTSASAKAEARS